MSLRRNSTVRSEAGIAYTQGDSQFDQVPPNSFPAKLTRVLYERYTAFKGAADKGLIILSCELIDNNGCLLYTSRCV